MKIDIKNLFRQLLGSASDEDQKMVEGFIRVISQQQDNIYRCETEIFKLKKEVEQLTKELKRLKNRQSD